jgi:prepilin peptidase CpaA
LLGHDELIAVIQWGAVLSASLVAAFSDVRVRRIPNWLTLPLAAAGLMMGAWRDGLPGAGDAVLGWLALAFPYILMFALGRGGAGDAKMMGAIGACLPLEAGLIVLCCVAITGGILALGRVLVSRQRHTALGNIVASIYLFLVALSLGRGGWGLLKAAPQEERIDTKTLTIPYGAAIFIGVCIGAVMVELWKA